MWAKAFCMRTRQKQRCAIFVPLKNEIGSWKVQGMVSIQKEIRTRSERDTHLHNLRPWRGKTGWHSSIHSNGSKGNSIARMPKILKKESIETQNYSIGAQEGIKEDLLKNCHLGGVLLLQGSPTCLPCLRSLVAVDPEFGDSNHAIPRSQRRSFSQRTPWGGGKKRGVENLTNDTPPKKGFLELPSHGTFSTPPRVSVTLFFLYKNPPTEQTRSSFGGVQKFSGERCSLVRFRPLIRFAPPPISRPNFDIDRLRFWEFLRVI